MSDTSTAPRPLGPDSLTWRYFGDWRGVLLALWAGSMQNMHPGLGAGVEEHSGFFSERWQRLFRSLYPINGVVYDGDRAEATAVAVRHHHDQVRGVDAKGRRYHALDPDTFYWAHATFFMSIIVLNEHFGERLTEEDKERLYAESVEWYRLYGMSMRPVPADWADFQRYWDRMCEEILEDNKATRDVLDLSRLPKPPNAGWIPDPLWALSRPMLAATTVWLTTGLYPEPVRKRLGLGWHVWDQVGLDLVGTTARVVWRFVPQSRRMHPRARAAWRRAEGRDSENTPLVETPRRNLPPVDERGDPKHYCPFG